MIIFLSFLTIFFYRRFDIKVHSFRLCQTSSNYNLNVQYVTRLFMKKSASKGGIFVICDSIVKKILSLEKVRNLENPQHKLIICL